MAEELEEQLDNTDLEELTHLEKIEAFRQVSLELGITGARQVLSTMVQLERFLKNNPRITNWDEARIATAMVKALAVPTTDLWAKALGVQTLMEQLEEPQDG